MTNAPMTLSEKLQIKPGKRWLFFNAPQNYLTVIEPLPADVTINFEPAGDFDGIQVFVMNSAEVESTLKEIAPLLKPDTIFWITYPKKSSGIKSDLEMMSSWDEPAKYGLTTVTSVSVNETWTALRFKPVELVKSSECCNENIPTNPYGEYIDIDKKVITLPPDVADILGKNQTAMGFYQQLSWSNKKEYVVWILSAKQEKTRQERLVKMVEKLSAGKKNPSEK
jgi:hypothetical protein